MSAGSSLWKRAKSVLDGASWARQDAVRIEDLTSLHTVYWPADRFDGDTVVQLQSEASWAFATYSGGPQGLAELLGIDDAAHAAAIHERVVHGLRVCDLRIDFEDGYGMVAFDRERSDAERVANEMARAVEDGTAAPRMGIRIKPLDDGGAERGVSTLQTWVGALAAALPDGGLPRLVVTLPKVTAPGQLELMEELLRQLERDVGWTEGTIELEFMVEVANAVFDEVGTLVLPRLVRAAGPRLTGVHLGVYDFTASYGLLACEQRMDHPVCDLVRGLMKMTCCGRGLVLSAGSTNILPPVTASDASQSDIDASYAAVREVWRATDSQIQHALRCGYYHGWDLHPAQIAMRYAACYRTFRAGFARAAPRLRGLLQRSRPVTYDESVLDDAATGQSLFAEVQRAHACGAIATEELSCAGLTPNEVGLRSFAELLRARRLARPSKET